MPKAQICKFQPLGSRILVKKVGPEKSARGILLPGKESEGAEEAVVVSVGQGHLLEGGLIRPLEVKVGDVVLLEPHAGTEVPSSEGQHLIVNQDDVLAIIVNRV